MDLDKIIEKTINEKAVNPMNQAIVDRIEMKLTHQLEVIKSQLKDLKKVDSRHSLSLLVDDIDDTGRNIISLAKSAKDYLKSNKPIQSVDY